MTGAAPASGVFISYRREDAAAYAGRLYDHLIASFGANRLFIDVDAIGPGVDFVERIDQALSSSTTMLVMIGPHWAGATTPDGRRRLDDPRDLVRREIASALDRGLLVIPVLVGAAQIPEVDDLPEDLVRLASRNAFRLDDVRWSADVESLTEMLVEGADGSRGSPRPAPALVLGLVISALLVGSVAVAIVQRSPASSPEPNSAVDASEGWIAFATGPNLFKGGGPAQLAEMRGNGQDLTALSERPSCCPTWSPDSSILAFEGVGGLYVMAPDGSGVRLLWGDHYEGWKQGMPGAFQITGSSTFEAAWSPNNGQLAFVVTSLAIVGRPDLEGVWIADVSGSTTQLVDKNDADDFGAPSWSPGGDAVAYVVSRGPVFELRVKEIRGRDTSVIKVRDPDLLTDSAWGPDGKIAVAITGAHGDSSVAVMNPDGTDERRVWLGDAGLIDDLSWSPDGSSLAFTFFANPSGSVLKTVSFAGPGDVLVGNPSSGTFTNLTESPADDLMPTWSPDGERIAFVSDRGDSYDVYVADVNGDRIELLLETGLDECFLAWGDPAA